MKKLLSLLKRRKKKKPKILVPLTGILAIKQLGGKLQYIIKKKYRRRIIIEEINDKQLAIRATNRLHPILTRLFERNKKHLDCELILIIDERCF